MKRFGLEAKKRDVAGKKLKQLRRDGILPANVYGKEIESQSLQVPYEEFDKVFKEAGETGLVDLKVEAKTTPVLIHNIQKDWRGKVLHADFFQVNLKEKVKATIPVETIGEPIAVAEKLGILMNIISEVEIEALPESLPEKIEINVESLANVDDQVTIADLKAPEGVEILTDSSQVVAKIGELITKEAAEQAAEEAAAAEAASTEAGEAAEGAEAAEGETTEGTPKENESADSKKETDNQG